MKYDTYCRRLGTRIGILRREQGLTQSKLAMRSGLSLKYISLLESGNNPSMKSLLQLSEGLGIALNRILDVTSTSPLPPARKRVEHVLANIPKKDPTFNGLVAIIRKLDEAQLRRALGIIKEI